MDPRTILDEVVKGMSLGMGDTLLKAIVAAVGCAWARSSKRQAQDERLRPQQNPAGTSETCPTSHPTSKQS